MIDRTMLVRLTLATVAVLAAAAGVGLALRASGAMIGGMGLGAAVGVVPFLSWGFVAGSLSGGAGRRALAALLLAGKLAAYAGAFYLLVTRGVVQPLGVMIGVTLAVFTFAVGALALPGARGART